MYSTCIFWNLAKTISNHCLILVVVVTWTSYFSYFSDSTDGMMTSILLQIALHVDMVEVHFIHLDDLPSLHPMWPPLPEELCFFSVLCPRCKYNFEMFQEGLGFMARFYKLQRSSKNRDLLTQWEPSTRNLVYSNSLGSRFNTYLCRQG